MIPLSIIPLYSNTFVWYTSVCQVAVSSRRLFVEWLSGKDHHKFEAKLKFGRWFRYHRRVYPTLSVSTPAKFDLCFRLSRTRGCSPFERWPGRTSRSVKRAVPLRHSRLTWQFRSPWCRLVHRAPSPPFTLARRRDNAVCCTWSGGGDHVWIHSQSCATRYFTFQDVIHECVIIIPKVSSGFLLPNRYVGRYKLPGVFVRQWHDALSSPLYQTKERCTNSQCSSCVLDSPRYSWNSVGNPKSTSLFRTPPHWVQK